MACGGGVFFTGYFRVDNSTSLVTGFYESIDGSPPDFNNNIFANNNLNRADNKFQNGNFTSGGTNIRYMNFFSNPSSPGYNSDFAYFTVKVSWGVYYISPLSITGHPYAINRSDFTITLTSDPSCFNEGTKILCLNNLAEEEYLPIENLRKGHLVKSYKHGYRKIDLIGKNPMINNPEIPSACMYKIEKTDHNGLTEDLIVTGGHSILVDDLGIFKEENDKLFGSTIMIDDKYLLIASVSNQFIKLENTNLYTYYHFILENEGNDDERFGVWANGVLTETPSKNQFTSHKYTLI